MEKSNEVIESLGTMLEGSSLMRLFPNLRPTVFLHVDGEGQVVSATMKLELVPPSVNDPSAVAASDPA